MFDMLLRKNVPTLKVTPSSDGPANLARFEIDLTLIHPAMASFSKNIDFNLRRAHRNTKKKFL